MNYIHIHTKTKYAWNKFYKLTEQILYIENKFFLRANKYIHMDKKYS
jgi:hypothetical protein